MIFCCFAPFNIGALIAATTTISNCRARQRNAIFTPANPSSPGLYRKVCMSHKIVALLPMKAHSQRVSGKNFRDFAGKPLFRWILDSLLAVEAIDRVVINTDARTILADNGLTDGDAGGRILIRDRKPDVCGDFVTMNLALADDIAAIEAASYAMKHTTNPLLSSRSEERRGGKEGVSTGRFRWASCHKKKKIKQ